jgi:hypothetical protein
MPLHRQGAQKYLQKFDFESLFIEELGWDTVDRVTLPFEVDGAPFEVVAISEKRGFTVFKCITPEIPARPLRVKLDRQLTDYRKSHLLVFGDEGKTQQTWMWVRQELGKPLAPRFEQYQVGQSAERLLQKLEALAIAFAEEEKLTLVEVAQRVKKAFDVEKVTKKFFTRFEKEHGEFLKFIQGIQSEFDRTWYASLMLNRLMFVYFIQKKNFLDDDINYLRNRLKRCQAEWGTDTFHSFYRQFLLKLFHEGLGKPDRNPELDQLLGKIPYLNGGLFEVHQLEEKYDRTLQIPDAAFEQVFNFFDEYDWHLDDRPLRNQNEINPDVLGYIFEKYINQKQMGAYYTKEDITEYISKNTILPFLFDAAKRKHPAAFRPHPLTPSPKKGEGEPEVSLTLLSPPGRGAGGEGKPRYEYFRKVLAEMSKHPNPRYFVLKSIMLNNLYGVDIMEEATEICKLRLFLKLVAQMEPQPKQPNFGLEPLPDIDFNIRAGNTLVGFASLDEVRKAITQDEVKRQKVKGKSTEVEADQFKLDLQDDASRINEKAELADRAFQRFRQMQTEFGMDAGDFRTAKKELRRRLAELNDELNHYLAREYGVDAKKPAAFEKWRDSHQPFHWFVEFYSIIYRGGFDVIIGNPPYIENKEVKQYKIKGYSCESAGNLYALVIERCFSLGSQLTYQGYIVPVSSISTDRYKPLQEILLSHESHISSFDDRPSRLFEGLEHIRLTIHIIGQLSKTPRVFSTRYNKWSASERDILFDCLRYAKTEISFLEGTVPKFSSEIEFNISAKLSRKSRLERFYNKLSSERIFYSRKVGYFLQVLDFEPKVLDGQGNRRPPSEFKELNFPTRSQAEIALCCLNSNLFYWFITVCSDCRHVNKREVDSLPIDLSNLETERAGNNLVKLAQKLMQDIDENSEERKMHFKHDTLSIQCIFPVKSKPIIDEIDRVLAHHYGFTDEELDFIINYDIKYRMGRDNGGDD